MQKSKPVIVSEAPTADDTLIADAQRSWVAIQEAQGSQLKHWLAVGRGLMIGRQRHPSNTAFSKWAMAAGFAFVSTDNRSDALWLAREWGSIEDRIQPGHTHPHVIRAYLRKADQGQVQPNEQPPVEDEAAVRPAAIIRKGQEAWEEIQEQQAERGEDEYGPLQVHPNWGGLRSEFDTMPEDDADRPDLLALLNMWSPDGVKRAASLRKASGEMRSLSVELTRIDIECVEGFTALAGLTFDRFPSYNEWLAARDPLIAQINVTTKKQNVLVAQMRKTGVATYKAQAEITAGRSAQLPPLKPAARKVRARRSSKGPKAPVPRTPSFQAPLPEAPPPTVSASMAGKTPSELKTLVALHPDLGVRAEARAALAALGAA